ncbi:DUF1573 domain-containing protein, partial [bacterium]|nr:DUF1573 domain-containing protein [bacterium]
MKFYFDCLKSFSLIIAILTVFSLDSVKADSSGLSDKSTKIPQAHFKELVWDFGKIVQGEKVSHTFEIKNTGSAELIIKKVHSSCGCTAVSPSKKKLLPGETAYLHTTFNSAGRKDYQSKKVYVTTNDPKTPNTALEIRAFVNVPEGPRIKLSTPVWDFGLQDKGATPELDVTVKNEGVSDLIFERIHTSDLCSATLIPETPIVPEGEAVLHLELMPLAKAGIVELYVNLLSNDTTRPNVSIRVIGYVKGKLPPKLAISPRKWDFGIVEKENFSPKQILIYMRNIGGKNLEIKEIKMPFGFEIGIDLPFTIAPHQETAVPFKLTRVSTAGTIKKLVFIYTNEPGFSNRRIDVYGYVKSLLNINK